MTPTSRLALLLLLAGAALVSASPATPPTLASIAAAAPSAAARPSSRADAAARTAATRAVDDVADGNTRLHQLQVLAPPGPTAWRRRLWRQSFWRRLMGVPLSPPPTKPRPQPPPSPTSRASRWALKPTAASRLPLRRVGRPPGRRLLARVGGAHAGRRGRHARRGCAVVEAKGVESHGRPRL